MSNDGIIRVLLTQDCMYDCFFCHKEGVKRKCEEKLEMQDVVFLMKTLNKKIHKDTVRLSGGEPLIRGDIVELVKELDSNNIKTLITTNGLLLDKKKEVCKYLKKLNISIHSLDEGKYKKITQSNEDINKIIHIVKNIRKEYPNLDITISITLLNNINSNKSEINKYINFGEKNGVNIKFIELFSDNKELFYSVENVKPILLEKGYKVKRKGLRKESYTKTNDAIITISKCFCASEEDRKKLGERCKKHNDLFITADGKISLCRINDEEIDILKEIKERDEENLIKKFNLAYEKLGNFCL